MSPLGSSLAYIYLVLNLVIDEKLRCHCYEAKSEKEAISRLKTEGIPPFVFIVDNRINHITDH